MGRPKSVENSSHGRPKSFKEIYPEIYDDIISTVCNGLIDRGLNAQRIVDEVNKKFGALLNPQLKREMSFKLWYQAARDGRLQYNAREEEKRELSLQRKCSQHKVVQVTVSSSTDYIDVAAAAARVVLQLILERPKGMSEFRIGWSGGNLCRLIAMRLADLLSRANPQHLPKRLIFQTLVGSWDITKPELHPNSFCSYFHNPELERRKKRGEFETEFRALFASRLLGNEDMQRALENDEHIKEARQQAMSVELILSSVGLRGDKANMFHNGFQAKNKQASKGWIGDFLALPVGAKGLLKEDVFDRRPLTLLGEKDLKELLDRAKHIVLAAGPTQEDREGGEPRCRTEVIQAVVSANLATHLVLDRRSAEELDTLMSPLREPARERDVYRLKSGDYAVIGRSLTLEEKRQLPRDAVCGSDERIILVPPAKLSLNGETGRKQT